MQFMVPLTSGPLFLDSVSRMQCCKVQALFWNGLMNMHSGPLLKEKHTLFAFFLRNYFFALAARPWGTPHVSVNG